MLFGDAIAVLIIHGVRFLDVKTPAARRQTEIRVIARLNDWGPELAEHVLTPRIPLLGIWALEILDVGHGRDVWISRRKSERPYDYFGVLNFLDA